MKSYNRIGLVDNHTSINQYRPTLITGRKKSLESALHVDNLLRPGQMGLDSFPKGDKFSEEVGATSGGFPNRKQSLEITSSTDPSRYDDQKRVDSPVAHVRKQSLDKELFSDKMNQPLYSQQPHPGIRPSSASMGPTNYQYHNGRPTNHAGAPYMYRPMPQMQPMFPAYNVRGHPNNFQSIQRGMAPGTFNHQFRFPPPASRPPQLIYPMVAQNHHHWNRPPNLNHASPSFGSNRIANTQPVRPVKLAAPYQMDQSNAQTDRKFECSASILPPDLPFKDLIEEKSGMPYTDFTSISSILRLRATGDSRTDLSFTFGDNRLRNIDSITYELLHLNAIRYATYLIEKGGCVPGSSVALLFKQAEYLDFLGALFGCFYAGLIAVPVTTHSFHSADEFLQIFFVLSHSKCTLAIAGESVYKSIQRYLSKKEFNHPQIQWVRTSEIHSFRKTEDLNLYFEQIQHDIAYLEYSKNSSGDLKAISMSHKVLLKQCSILKNYHAIYPSDIHLTCMEFRQGFGLLFGVFLGVFVGLHTVTVPNDMCQFPGLWMLAVSRFKATICLAQPMDLLGVISSLGKYVPGKKENIDLSTIKSLFIETISPDADFMAEIFEILSAFGLSGLNVITPILSLHEFGGITISIPPNILRLKGQLKLKTVLLDSKSAMESKVSILSITDDINTLSMGDNTPGFMRITESGHVLSQGSSDRYNSRF